MAFSFSFDILLDLGLWKEINEFTVLLRRIRLDASVLVRAHFRFVIMPNPLDGVGQELNNLAVNSEYRSLLKKLREKAAAEIRKKDGEFIDFLPKPKVQ